jgi:hypothetical protein
MNLSPISRGKYDGFTDRSGELQTHRSCNPEKQAGHVSDFKKKCVITAGS